MGQRRRTTVAVTTVAVVAGLAGLVSGPSALASGRQGARPAAPTRAIVPEGQLAYVTNAGAVELQSVAAGADPVAAPPVKIGPILTAGKGQTLQVSALVASGDGEWLAWSEFLVTTKTGASKSLLVQYDTRSGQTVDLRSEYYPVGFAKDQLMVTDADTTKSLVLSPAPHLVAFKTNQYALAAFADGVIDSQDIEAPAGPKRTDRLRLVTFGGTTKVLHSYVLGKYNYRDLDQAWVSSDQHKLIVERGNHEDFDGLGPSSLADEFSLSTGHRSTLGHFGSDGGKWRIGGVTFVGSGDTPWAMWERGANPRPVSVVASFAKGAWHRFASPAGVSDVAVAGSTNGYVVVQPGKYVLVNPNDEGYDVRASGSAELDFQGARTSIGVRGAQLVWVTAPLEPN